MNPPSIHSDSINGVPVDLVLNAPYETLVNGSGFVKGNAIRDFCQNKNSNFALIVGQQVWASPYKGLMLSVFIDQYLAQWGIREECTIYLPLDSSIYCVDIGRFGAVEQGSEVILSYEETLESTPPILHVLSAGQLSEAFENCIDIETSGSNWQKEYSLKSLNKALFANRYFIVPHFLGAGGLALAALAAFFVLPSLINRNSESAIRDIVEEIVQVKGTDLAVSQLTFLNTVLEQDIRYFIGKGLTRFSYNTDTGISIEGSYPGAAVLQQLINDAGAAELQLNLTQSGWLINKHPVIELRETFELEPFRENYLAVQKLQEQYGFNVAMGTPSTDLNKKTVTLEFSSTLNVRPSLLHFANALEGHSVSVSVLEITFNEYKYEFMKLGLIITGSRS